MPTDLDSITVASTIKAMLVGEPSNRKSFHGASFAYGGDMYILDTDERIQSLLKEIDGKPLIPPEIRKRIKVDTYGPLQYAKFEKDHVKLREYCPYKTVFFDGLTTVTEKAFAYMKNFDAGGRVKIGEIMTPGQTEFAGEIEALRAILGTASDLFNKGINVLISAHIIKTQSENRLTGKTTTKADLWTGGKKVAAMIPGVFNEVWFFYNRISVDGGMEYVMSTVRSAESPIDLAAKTALPLPPLINVTNEPLYLKLQKLLKEKNIELS